MYMLDTNAIIMAVRHPDWPIYPKIKAHLGKDLCISAVTYGELEYGIRKSANPEKNRVAITKILLGIPVLAYDSRAAAHFGDIFADLEARRVKNNPDGLFFTPEVCAARRPKPPVILHRFRLRENASGSRSASGIVGKNED